MDENYQYTYQIPDLKTRFQIGFGNIIEQIVNLLTYSEMYGDTETFDNEELKYKLRAAIAYALALLGSTWGYAISAQAQRDVEIAKESLKALFSKIIKDSEISYLDLLEIYYELTQKVSIILNYGTPIPRPRTGEPEVI